MINYKPIIIIIQITNNIVNLKKNVYIINEKILYIIKFEFLIFLLLKNYDLSNKCHFTGCIKILKILRGLHSYIFLMKKLTLVFFIYINLQTTYGNTK